MADFAIFDFYRPKENTAEIGRSEWLLTINLPVDVNLFDFDKTYEVYWPCEKGNKTQKRCIAKVVKFGGRFN
jgi:hypothetical protein